MATELGKHVRRDVFVTAFRASIKLCAAGRGFGSRRRRWTTAEKGHLPAATEECRPPDRTFIIYDAI